MVSRAGFSRFTLGAALSCALLVPLATVAQAGGYSSHGRAGHVGGYASASAIAQHYINAKIGHFNFKSQAEAKSNTLVGYGGKYIEGNASAGHWTKLKGYGKVKYKEYNFAKSKVIAKGKNILAKARAEKKVKIYVKGKIYFVSESEVRTMARFTPLGTTAAASAVGNAYFYGHGNVSFASDARTGAYVRVVR